MSAPKSLPLPRDQLITNVEIMALTGFNLNRVNLLKAKPLFPKILCFSPCRTALYKKSAVLEWFKRFPQKTQKTRKPQFFDNPRKNKTAYTRTRRTVFDNQLCVRFVIGKVKTKFPGTGRTTTVHLDELNWG